MTTNDSLGKNTCIIYNQGNISKRQRKITRKTQTAKQDDNNNVNYE